MADENARTWHTGPQDLLALNYHVCLSPGELGDRTGGKEYDGRGHRCRLERKITHMQRSQEDHSTNPSQ